MHTRYLYKGTKVAGRVDSVRFIRPDVAIMHVSATVPSRGVVADPASPEFEPTARISILAVKDGERWRIEAFQNTPVQPPGPPQGQQQG
jgi:uncharacterized protein (TIGR02246 family)